MNSSPKSNSAIHKNNQKSILINHKQKQYSQLKNDIIKEEANNNDKSIEGKELQIEENQEQLEYEVCDDDKYNQLNSKIENLKGLSFQMEKTFNLQEKMCRKKIKETLKQKDLISEKLEGMKDENDLLNKEILYLSQQLEELNKNKENK